MPSLRIHALAVALALPLLLPTTSRAGETPSRPAQLTLAGALDRGGIVTAARMQALPVVTSAGRTPASPAYIGASLWSLLDQAGLQIDTTQRNDLLNRYAVVTGADGQRAVFSLGELSPHFGNRPGLVAYAESVRGAASPLREAGAVQVIASGDVQGGRHVPWPVRVEVRRSASTLPDPGDVISSAVRVSGAVRRPGTFDLAALRALPAVTQRVGGETYTGVSLWYLLNTTLGLATDPAIRNHAQGMYVVATGSDGGKAVVSLGEIDPAGGNQPDIVAYLVNGAPIEIEGFARLILPNDGRPTRFVSNLVALEVFVARP